MSFLSRIKDFFSPKPSLIDEGLGYAVSDDSKIQNSEIQRFSENDSKIQNSEIDRLNFQNNSELKIQNRSDGRSELPHWLSNEDALRDEGVIFGLSDSKSEEKTAVIRTFFSHQTADLEQEVSVLNEKIGELNLFLEQKESRITELTEKTNLLEKREPAEHSMPRTVVGLLLSLGMCAGNYYLIDESIKTSFPQNHYGISLGIFLAGMFNLFGRTSFLHEKNTSITFRQILEEVGMPLAASIFVFVQTFENQSLIKSFALFFFVFFLFLFAGKLLLSNLTLIKNDTGNWLENLRLKADKVNKTKDWEEEILKLKAEMDELRIKKWQIINDLKTPEAELTRLNGKRDMLIKLFDSEFNLARSYRERLSSKQIRQILE